MSGVGKLFGPRATCGYGNCMAGHECSQNWGLGCGRGEGSGWGSGVWGGAGDKGLWVQEGAPSWDQGIQRAGGGSGLGRGSGLEAPDSLSQAAHGSSNMSLLWLLGGGAARWLCALPCPQVLPLQFPLAGNHGQWELQGHWLGQGQCADPLGCPYAWEPEAGHAAASGSHPEPGHAQSGTSPGPRSPAGASGPDVAPRPVVCPPRPRPARAGFSHTPTQRAADDTRHAAQRLSSGRHAGRGYPAAIARWTGPRPGGGGGAAQAPGSQSRSSGRGGGVRRAKARGGQARGTTQPAGKGGAELEPPRAEEGTWAGLSPETSGARPARAPQEGRCAARRGREPASPRVPSGPGSCRGHQCVGAPGRGRSLASCGPGWNALPPGPTSIGPVPARDANGPPGAKFKPRNETNGLRGPSAAAEPGGAGSLRGGSGARDPLPPPDTGGLFL
ncbi:unnamed protein product [Lepidochelys kempii]